MPRRLLAAACLVALASACAPPDVDAVTLTLVHELNGKALTFDAPGSYTNAAGNTYGVTRLQYYLHGLTFFPVGGGPEVVVKDPIYVDGRKELSFPLGALPAGEYEKLTFVLGLLPEQNKTGALTNTTENVQMAWPDSMGGGYHFIKFEGRYGADKGFAIHLGNDEALTKLELTKRFKLEGKADTVTLVFNPDEGFGTPTVFDLEVLNYTMGNMPEMKKVSANLMDAFTLREP